MPGERKIIRDAVTAVVKNAVTCDFFASRNLDVRDLKEFVNVYFDSGDVAYDGVRSFTTASLVVSYSTADVVNDDLIDEVADAIHAALGAADIAPQLIQGFIPAGWDYPADQERAFSGINLRYTVTY